jgi:hypothetical protein
MTSSPRRRTPHGTKKVHTLTAQDLVVGSPTVGAPSLLAGWTAGQIAQKLSARWPNEKATVIRIRHWVKEHLLFPLGEFHPGTGQHHLFNDDAIVMAAVLGVIADRGISVVAFPRESLLAALTLASNAYRQFTTAYAKGHNFTRYLALLDSRPNGRQVELYSALPSSSSAESVFVINLGQLFQHIRRT